MEFIIPAIVAVLRAFLWLCAIGGAAITCFLIGRMIEGWRVRE